MSESIASSLADAGILLAVGMSVVFTFLVILIFVIGLIEKFCQRFPGEEAVAQVPARRAAANNEQVSPQVVAAISAAVHQHRNSK